MAKLQIQNLMQMPMGGMSPYQALRMQQQQALLGTSQGESTVSGSPVGAPKRSDLLDDPSQHKTFDVLVSGNLKNPGYAWMTTRTTSLLVAIPANSSSGTLAVRAKLFKGGISSPRTREKDT